MFSFDNNRALVVGAAGGIGRALALEFARRGAHVVAADIDDDGAADTAAQINDWFYPEIVNTLPKSHNWPLEVRYGEENPAEIFA